MLDIVDDLTSECLALLSDRSILGSRMARKLQDIVAERGVPAMEVSDNIPNSCRSLPCTGSRRAASNRIALHPRKPTDNAFIEAFNGQLRAECLNAHWFMTLADAREKLECWRRDYNEVRPHGAIGNKVPISLLNPAGATSPSAANKAENSSFE